MRTACQKRCLVIGALLAKAKICIFVRHALIRLGNLRFGKTNTYFGKAGVRSKEFNLKLVELTWSRGPVLAKAHIGPRNLSSNLLVTGYLFALLALRNLFQKPSVVVVEYVLFAGLARGQPRPGQ